MCCGQWDKNILRLFSNFWHSAKYHMPFGIPSMLFEGSTENGAWQACWTKRERTPLPLPLLPLLLLILPLLPLLPLLLLLPLPPPLPLLPLLLLLPLPPPLPLLLPLPRLQAPCPC